MRAPGARELLTRLATHLHRPRARRREAESLRASEERLRLATSAGKFGDWELELPDMAFTASAQCKANYGFAADEPFTVAMFRAAVHPDDLERVEAAVVQSLRSGQDYEADYRCVWPDGSVHWINARGRAFVGRDGRVNRMVGVTLDITGRKQAEQALEESRRQLQAVLDVLPLPLFLTDDTGRVFARNPAADEMWGAAPLSAHPAAYREDYRAWWPGTGRRVESHEWGMARALADGVTVSAEEMEVETRDGQRSTILNYARPIRDAGGRITGGVALNVDITDRRRAEEALRESEQRLRLALQGANAGVWQLDVRSGRMFWSEEFAPLYGYDAATPFSQKQWADGVDPDDRARIEAEFRALLGSTATTFRQDYRILHPVRGVRWILNIGRIARDARGVAVRCDGLNIDITERRQAEDALREADRRKDEFLATLAHELRNPLAPLRSALEVMKLAGPDAAAAAKARGMMERQLRQMVRLIDDLLDVSRISRGLVELRRERVEIGEALHGAFETVRPLLAQSAVTIRSAAEPLLVDADVTRLTQVFSNLLGNAAKFSDPGGRIVLSAERQGDEAVVRVRDDGIGIPLDRRDEIFELFTQVDRSPERSQGGLGIGLSLVKRLVEMHGGTVVAQSEGPGRGSEFVVRLPLATTPSPDEVSRVAPEEPRQAGCRRILVVDDNRDAAQSLAVMLRMMGNETQTAHDGLEALEVAPLFRPDVVLLDIGMPRLDGYGTARRLREQGWSRGVVLVALTGWGADEDRQRSHEAGFDFHLVKPVEPAALAKLLAETAAAR